MENFEFSYLYRDGGNHKKWGKVVFSNPERLEAGSVENELREVFLEEGLFIASQIRVPAVFLYADGQLSLDDHCYHELDRVGPTSESIDDSHRRSISQFVAEVNQVVQSGWQVFDPYDSEGSLGSRLTSRSSPTRGARHLDSAKF